MHTVTILVYELMTKARIASLHWRPNTSDGYFHVQRYILSDLQLGTKIMLEFAFL